MIERTPDEKPGPITHYTVDGSLQSTTLEELTPRDILSNADIDPETHYLVRVDGPNGRSYRDDPDRLIRIEEHMKFKSVDKGS